MVQTGIYLQIPEGYEIQVRPRSGLAIKHGIIVTNSPGTIDSTPVLKSYQQFQEVINSSLFIINIYCIFT